MLYWFGQYSSDFKQCCSCIAHGREGVFVLEFLSHLVVLYLLLLVEHCWKFTMTTHLSKITEKQLQFSISLQSVKTFVHKAEHYKIRQYKIFYVSLFLSIYFALFMENR